CTNPLEHKALYRFFAANQSTILQHDQERKIYRPNMVLGPGIWNPVQYGRAWKFEIKLPNIRTQDMFIWMPTTVQLTTPMPNVSTLDWMLKYSADMDFLLLILSASTSKVTASMVCIFSILCYFPTMVTLNGFLDFMP